MSASDDNNDDDLDPAAYLAANPEVAEEMLADYDFQLGGEDRRTWSKPKDEITFIEVRLDKAPEAFGAPRQREQN